ncbi:MAG: hypothetical protein WC996_04185, partial [Peptostreptococcales bacterium]
KKDIALYQDKIVDDNVKLDNAKKYKELEKDLVLLEKRKSIESELKGLETENKKYEKINDAIMGEAIALEKKISESMIKLKSAELAGKVIHSDNPVHIIDVYGKSQTIAQGDTWTANGYMKIEIKDALELEVKSNQISVDEVKSTLEEASKELAALLKQLEMASIIDAQVALQNKKGNDIKISSLQKQLKDLPNDEKKAALEEEKIRLDGLALEKIEVLENRIKDAQQKINEIRIDMAKLENKVENWQKTYQSFDELMQYFGEVFVKKNNKKDELSKLKALPPEYDSLEDYLSYIREMRHQKEDHLQKIQQIKFEIERMMDQFPDRSIEELESLIKEETRHFENAIKKAKQMITIIETFEATIELLENDSISPLQRKFAENLKYITDNRYDAINISDQMDVNIGNGKENLPTHLLSSGTLDSASLAFRLALIDELLGEKQGFTVLDDSLVNMDEERQSRSIKMIQDHSKKHQVIFVTCHPDVAEELGGNKIRL